MGTQQPGQEPLENVVLGLKDSESLLLDDERHRLPVALDQLAHDLRDGIVIEGVGLPGLADHEPQDALLDAVPLFHGIGQFRPDFFKQHWSLDSKKSYGLVERREPVAKLIG